MKELLAKHADSYMIKNWNSRILERSLQMKRREWFKGLWSSSELISWSFIVAS